MEEEKKEEVQEFNESEFLKKVEKAASKGVSKGALKNGFISSLPTLLVILFLACLVVPRVNAFTEGFNSIFHLDEPVENHDVTITNHSIFGYQAADFEDAILGDSSNLKKLEVMSQEISDAMTITDTGFLNWGVFTKNQIITYNGTVVYTVDLGKLGRNDIKYDNDTRTITMYIPHAVQEEINIPEDAIQFGDVNKGFLAFGSIKLTPEQASEVQSGARKKMEKKLEDSNTLATADRFAKLVVWEVYNPIIKSVGKDCSLVIEFKD